MAPGHSAGRTSIFGNYTQQTDAILDIEIGGISVISEYDEVQVTGTAALDGELQLSLINSFVPNAGNVFGILTAGASRARSPMSRMASGWTRSTVLVHSSCITAQEAHSHQTVYSSPTSSRAQLPGDFNGDGAVDAADYVVWRKV